MKTAVLLVNLGTPDAPDTKSVRKYLTEFLMDPEVISIPFLFRWILVKAIIGPFRSPKSAEAYSKIWTRDGSPLRIGHYELAKALQKRLDADGREVHKFVIVPAMRYGNPSIESALLRIKQETPDNIIVAPLYPQYATSTTRSTETHVHKLIQKDSCLKKIPVQVLRPFFAKSEFIRSVANQVRESIKEVRLSDRFLMSYHGLPESHILEFEKENRSTQDCLQASCCAKPESIQFCYKAQCHATSRLIAQDLGLRDEQFTTSFQSRLGRTPWIGPATESVITDLAVKLSLDQRLIVLTPAFVQDCLETLEELGERAHDDWKTKSRVEFQLIPCVNQRADWVAGLAELIKSV